MSQSSPQPGHALCEAFLRPLDQARMDRDRVDYIRAIKDLHRGETLFVLGTGPSVRTVPGELLSRYSTIGCNGIGYVWQPDHYIICDPFVYALHEPIFLACPGQRILSSFTEGQCDLRIYYRREDVLGFSRDQVFSADSTGFIALSTAYVMGASRIVLVGFDGYPAGETQYHCYDEPAVEVARVRYEWQPGSGKDSLLRAAFSHARDAALRDGCEIRRLTPSTLLDGIIPMITPQELAAS